jgi:hemerythrin
MSLQWREQLSVGNDLIDNDHKRLIEIINRAEVSLKSINPP